MKVSETSRENLNKGIALCAENSNALLKDAEILFKCSSYGHGLALAVMAMEEHGKRMMLIAARLGLKSLDQDFWRMFRSHEEKLALAIYTLMKEYPDVPLESEILKIMVDRSSKLERLRRLGFYVDYDSDKRKWLSPSDKELREIAQMQIEYTKILIKKTDPWLKKIMEKTD